MSVWTANLALALHLKKDLGATDASLPIGFTPASAGRARGRRPEDLVVLECKERKTGAILAPTNVGKSVLAWKIALFQKWWTGCAVQFFDRQQEYDGLRKPVSYRRFVQSPLADLGFVPAGEPTFTLRPTLFAGKRFRVPHDTELTLSIKDLWGLESEKAEQALNALFGVDAAASPTHRSFAGQLIARLGDNRGDLTTRQLLSAYDAIAAASEVTQGAPKLRDALAHYSARGWFDVPNGGLMEKLYAIRRLNIVVLGTLLPAVQSANRPAYDALASWLNGLVVTVRDKDLSLPPLKRKPPVFRVLDEYELGMTPEQSANERSEMEKESRLGLSSVRVTQNPANASDEVFANGNYVLSKALGEKQRERVAAFAKSPLRTHRLILETFAHARRWHYLNLKTLEEGLFDAALTPSVPIRGDYS